MLYRIANAVSHPNHTVTITWSNSVTADVDLSPVIAKGNVFASVADAAYFVAKMRIGTDRLGLEWPDRCELVMTSVTLRLAYITDRPPAGLKRALINGGQLEPRCLSR